jgi:hypothetical protein
VDNVNEQIPGVGIDDDDQITEVDDEDSSNDEDPAPRRGHRQQRAPDRLIQSHMIEEAETMNILEQTATIRFASNIPQAHIFKPEVYKGDYHRVVMTQYTIKKGLKLFAKQGADAVLEEVKQLHEMNTIKIQKRSSGRYNLQYLMDLKKKRCRGIKGRGGCAGGRKQRSYIDKNDASSPTASLEALFMTCIIDAKENRYMVISYVPGAFLQTDMDEEVHVRFDGPMTEALENQTRPSIESLLPMKKENQSCTPCCRRS